MKFVHGRLCARGSGKKKKQVTRCYTGTQLPCERFGVVSLDLLAKMALQMAACWCLALRSWTEVLIWVALGVLFVVWMFSNSWVGVNEQVKRSWRLTPNPDDLQQSRGRFVRKRESVQHQFGEQHHGQFPDFSHDWMKLLRSCNEPDSGR